MANFPARASRAPMSMGISESGMIGSMALSQVKRWAALFFLVFASACSTLPSSGPTASQVLSNQKAGSIPLAVINVNEAVLTDPLLGEEVIGKQPVTLSSMSATGRVDTVGPGDVLDIRIYEVGVALFGGGGLRGGTGFDPSARAENLSFVVVNEDGTIKLPYIGKLNVAGKTVAEIQSMVEAGLADKSQSPQALVAIQQNVSNVVYVSGDVVRPGMQPLTIVRLRLLDAVANAGGARTATADTLVRFARGDKLIEQRLASITPGGPDDLILLPGDRIELLKAPRTYTVFGASQKVAQVPFESETVSLAEALARIGGPNDATADASAVFLFRFAKDPADVTREKPVIYRLNMMQPTSYFLSQKFAMRDKDVLYVATAASNQPSKLVQIINQLFAPLVLAREVTR